MSERTLSRRLSALAATMRELAEDLHETGAGIDRGDYHVAYRFHQHADEMIGAAKCALQWAEEVARWEGKILRVPSPGGSDPATADMAIERGIDR